MELFLIFIGAVFVNNFVLVRFLGICPFMGVSKQTETALGMGAATTFVMVVTAALTWLLQWYVLEPFGLPFLQTPVFILVIASMVQLVEMFLHKTSPGLYRALGFTCPSLPPIARIGLFPNRGARCVLLYPIADLWIRCGHWFYYRAHAYGRYPGRVEVRRCAQAFGWNRDRIYHCGPFVPSL